VLVSAAQVMYHMRAVVIRPIGIAVFLSFSEYAILAQSTPPANRTIKLSSL
jgi:hypothetical protein